MKKFVNKQIVFAGNGFHSYCIDTETKKGEDKEKKRPISQYKVLLVDEEEHIVASDKTEDKFVVDLADDNIIGVFRQSVRDGNKEMVPFRGIFCCVWFEGKKANKICFLWCQLLQENYKYANFACLGIEQDIVLRICDYVFTQLKGLLSSTLSKAFTKNDTDHYIETQISGDEENE